MSVMMDRGQYRVVEFGYDRLASIGTELWYTEDGRNQTPSLCSHVRHVQIPCSREIMTMVHGCKFPRYCCGKWVLLSTRDHATAGEYFAFRLLEMRPNTAQPTHACPDFSNLDCRHNIV
jgi:hypothetical protein